MSHSVDSVEWLNVCGRKMGIPYSEYSVMPIGELSDLYDFFLASDGTGKLVEKKDYNFFPEVR